jgi:hypothetical protein
MTSRGFRWPPRPLKLLAATPRRSHSQKAASDASRVFSAMANRWWYRYLQDERTRGATQRSFEPSAPFAAAARRGRGSADLARPRGDRVRADAPGPNRRSLSLDRVKVLRRPRGSRDAYARHSFTPAYEWLYERLHSGVLLHVDVQLLARFSQPEHRAVGDRQRRSRAIGDEYLHFVVDDHSRLAYGERHSHQAAKTAARVLERALAPSPISACSTRGGG